MTAQERVERVAPIFPDGYPRGQRLAPLLHSAVRDVKRGRDKRIEITRHDPLLFALLYLSSYLKDEIAGVISFSELHLALCDRAMRWVAPEPDRSAWASHRDAGKTVWPFLVFPLWLGAHGHRRFFLALSYTSDQAKGHLANLRAAIDAGGLLLNDFPHLAPKRGVGTFNRAHWVTSGGMTFSAAGLKESILGRRSREVRPDCIAGDELDPGEEDFTPAGKAKTVGRLTHDILPMGSRRAVVMLTGTPTASGSLMHDVQRAARGRPGALEDRGEWVRAEGIDPHWHPALVDEGTPRERSAWPTHWPTETLQAMRAASPRVFALQYQCDPDAKAAQQWWTEETFAGRYDPHFAADWRVFSIDGAVTSKRTDVDHTALVCLAVGPGVGPNRRVCAEYAAAGSWSRTELKEKLYELAERYPRSRKTIIVEGNQGGELWEEILTPPPPGCELEEPFYAQGTKRHRIESLYDEYTRGAVWHAGHLTALQRQLVAWKPGRSGHGVDDLIDALGAAVRRALYGTPGKAPPSRRPRQR